MKPGMVSKITRTGFDAVTKLKANSPHLMFGVGVVAVVGGAVLASRATLRIDKRLEETQHQLDDINAIEHVDYTETMRTKDRIVVYTELVVDLTKLYAPAIIVGGIGIASLTGSHVVLTRRNAALTAAYAAIERSYTLYRKAIREEFGEEREREFHRRVEARSINEKRAELEKKGLTPEQVKRGIETSQYARFFDESNRNWKSVPSHNRIFLEAQQEYLNQMLIARGHVLLNDVYEALGFERTSAGAIVGWVYGNGDNFIDFGLYDTGRKGARVFMNGDDPTVLLDFNVDGVVYNLIDTRTRGR